MTIKVPSLSIAFVCIGLSANAQTPLSAIDWLSDSVATPRELPLGLAEPAITQSALPEAVTVDELGGPVPDAVGLVPASASKLPSDIWRGSTSTDIARRIKTDRHDHLPAMLDLIYTLLLTEFDPPADSGPASVLFLARIDALLALGAVEQAQALLLHVGASNPEVFRRFFDTSLLLHAENRACATLRTTPNLSPTFPARIFCLARGGDWDAAALTLETARALGFVDSHEDELLARFLEPALADGAPPLVSTSPPSPLEFRLLEAIGEPIPTTKLPRAFAHSDLHTNTGWKPQLEAAERLVRVGATDPNFLLGLYSERKPAASGGLWDRVSAVQEFQKALRSGRESAIDDTLPAAWREITRVELEVPFAKSYAVSLAEIDLSGDAKEIAFQLGLLSGEFDTHADASAYNDQFAILAGIARGQTTGLTSDDPLTRAVLEGFETYGMPVRLQALTRQGRTGEAILRSIDLFANGSMGDLDELSDALTYLRSIGLDETARLAALQLLLLDRRG